MDHIDASDLANDVARFDDRFSVEHLLACYAEALPSAAAGELVDRVTRNIEDVRGLSPADFLDATTDLVAELARPPPHDGR